MICPGCTPPLTQNQMGLAPAFPMTRMNKWHRKWMDGRMILWDSDHDNEFIKDNYMIAFCNSFPLRKTFLFRGPSITQNDPFIVIFNDKFKSNSKNCLN